MSLLRCATMGASNSGWFLIWLHSLKRCLLLWVAMLFWLFSLGGSFLPRVLPSTLFWALSIFWYIFLSYLLTQSSEKLLLYTYFRLVAWYDMKRLRKLHSSVEFISNKFNFDSSSLFETRPNILVMPRENVQTFGYLFHSSVMHKMFRRFKNIRELSVRSKYFGTL